MKELQEKSTKKQERRFKGLWIEAGIWLTKDFTLRQKVFIAEIDSLDNELGCIASNQYFSEFFGISTTQVSTTISSLVKAGIINVFYNKDNSRIIRINREKFNTYLSFLKDPLKENLKTSLRKLKDPSLRKLKTYNKDIYNKFISNSITLPENLDSPEFHSIWEEWME